MATFDPCLVFLLTVFKVESGNIGKGSIHPSVCLFVHPYTFLHDGWMDYFHIGYNDQVPRVTDARKIDVFHLEKNLQNHFDFRH